jgi:hypothetical protein
MDRRIRSMMETLRENLRQFIYYDKEFRIAAPKWTDFSEALEDMISLLKCAPPETEADSGKEEGLLNLAVEMGTTVWRLQRRLTTEGGDVTAEIRRVSRDLESAWDALKQGGIEIKDHTGERYDGHMVLRVITFQPVAGLSQDQVIETIKPTIYRKDKLIQMGEVIVGVPEADTALNPPTQTRIEQEG